MRLVLPLMCSAVVLTVLPTGFSLKCHTCYSTVSWDECLEHSWLYDCKTGYDTCTTVFISKKRKTGQQENEFAKTCNVLSSCNEEICRLESFTGDELNVTDAVSCDVKCCHSDSCNEGTTNSGAHSITATVACYITGFYLAAKL